MGFEVTHPEVTARQIEARQRRRSEAISALRRARLISVALAAGTDPALPSSAEIAARESRGPIGPALPLLCENCLKKGRGRWSFGYLQRSTDGEWFVSLYATRSSPNGSRRAWELSRMMHDETGKPLTSPVPFVCHQCKSVRRVRASVIARRWKGSWPPLTTDALCI